MITPEQLRLWQNEDNVVRNSEYFYAKQLVEELLGTRSQEIVSTIDKYEWYEKARKVINLLQESEWEREAERWCERFRFVHENFGVDGSGVDSGDPLDVLDSEIRQAFDILGGQIAEKDARIKQILGR